MSNCSEYPMNINVNWPKNEKIIGVLGFSPIAISDFINKLVSRRLLKEWHYPRILVDINSKVPSRGRYFELGETDPVPYIRKDIESLCERGADFIVIPCNTAHILYDRFASNLSVPIPHIIDITCAAVINAGIKRPVVLCSRSTREHQLFKKAYQNVIDFPNQALISEGIEKIKQNKNANSITKQILLSLADINDIDGIIYGCTEIGILMHSVKLHVPVIDSNKALADFCYNFAKNRVSYKHIRMSAR